MMEKNFLNPKEIIKQINVSPGSTVVDFGCGSGFFSLAFSESVGSEGKVYSLDILPSALESVESKAKISGINNIIAQRANLEKENGSKLGNEAVDWVIMKDMLFQNKMKEVVIEEAYRILKNGGRALVIEWSNKDAMIGPDINLRIVAEDLKKIAEAKGFKIEKEIQAGDFHYGIVLVK